jgi:hypothetical protein
LDQKPGAEIEWKLTWHCCICWNPAKGRVDFEDGWLIKSSFIIKDKIPTKKQTKNNIYFAVFDIKVSKNFAISNSKM